MVPHGHPNICSIQKLFGGSFYLKAAAVIIYTIMLILNIISTHIALYCWTVYSCRSVATVTSGLLLRDLNLHLDFYEVLPK